MPTSQDLLELARQHRAAGRLVQAEQAFNQWSQLKLDDPPTDAQGWNDFGTLLGQTGKYDAAIKAFANAIKLAPGFLAAQQNLAMALERKGDLDQAEAVNRNTLAIDPNFVLAWDALGNVLALQGKMDQAIECFQRALELSPASNSLQFRLGKALYLSGDTTRGIAILQSLSQADAQNVETLHELAQALRQACRFHDAMNTLEQLLSIDPRHIGALGIRAMLYLNLGDFERGWRAYEMRWESESFPDKKRAYPQPQWIGQDPAGKTIFLYGEQGAGDMFMFSRYVPLIALRGGTVVLECPSDLSPVIKTVAGISQIILKGASFSAFDYHCSLMSLPLAFQTRLDTVPATVPYVTALPQYTAEWISRLAPFAKEFKVGLVWSGNPKHSNDKRRSFHLNTFAPLAAVPNVRFFSLQKGPGAAQALSSSAPIKLINFTASMSHFGDTAALIDNLDLIITVDTAVAHLAGAMAKPVWLLLPYSSEWRWLVDRDDSPWYPTTRLFRQDATATWQPVISRVAAELEKLASKKESK